MNGSCNTCAHWGREPAGADYAECRLSQEHYTCPLYELRRYVNRQQMYNKVRQMRVRRATEENRG